MMNKIWSIMMIISVLSAIATDNIANLSTGILDGASQAVELIFTIAAMMCLWSGVMNIAQKSGLTTILAKAFSPVLSKLLPEYSHDDRVMGAVCMNVSANLLGLGNAATPFGIRAMKEMSRVNKHNTTASPGMIMFVVLNTASIQLIPTTIAALRRSAGSQAPMSILPYVWLCSSCALAIGITVTALLNRTRKRRV